MKKICSLLMAIFPVMFSAAAQDSNERVATKIIAMEKTALEEWNKGNPSGYLDIYAPDVTYFDPFLKKRVDGFDKIRELYEALRGQVAADRYEMIDPKVQVTKEMAILTYNLLSYEGENEYKWNCTEVYRLEPDKQWKIAHVHWSFIRPMDK